MVLSFLRDVTRQKKLEDQLAQYRKMEAIGRLAGGIAHDYNNLLSVIIGYANLLLTRPGNGSPFTKEINEIRRAAERAADLTAADPRVLPASSSSSRRSSASTTSSGT